MARLPIVNSELSSARKSSHYETKMSMATQASVVEIARGADATEKLAEETARVADATETMAMVEYLRIVADLLDRGLVSEERVVGLEKKLAERFERVLE